MLTHDMPNIVKSYYSAQVKGQRPAQNILDRIQRVWVILLRKLSNVEKHKVLQAKGRIHKFDLVCKIFIRLAPVLYCIGMQK